MARLFELVVLAFVSTAFGEDAFSALPNQFVDISSKGGELWALDRFHGVYRFANNAWNLLPLNVSGGQMNGGPASVGASPDGFTWITTNTSTIYRWNMTTQSWESFTGGLNQVNAIARDRAVGTKKGEVWMFKNGAWEQVPFEGHATWAAIGENDERWVVDQEGWLYRWNSMAGGGWTRMPGLEISSVDVQNAERVVIVSKCGRMYFWQNGKWSKIENVRAIRATINPNSIYYVDEIENVMKSGTDLFSKLGLTTKA